MPGVKCIEKLRYSSKIATEILFDVDIDLIHFLHAPYGQLLWELKI